jgi:uncharacterized membrane protein
MAKKLKTFWLLFFVLNISVVLWLQTQLPETVATHFDSHGQPNGWMSKSFYLTFNLGISIATNGLYLFLYFLRRQQKDVLVATGIFTNVIFLVTHHIVSQENGGWVSFRAPVNAWVGFIFALSVVFLIIVFKMENARRASRNKN